ncbi:hypothetical protein [Blastococcus deserti]|uniref:Uncharacterized protein n=1 Tax=Blastococcus deserti TaxID=2259033 RepID=A0ABW4XCZ3_9ACTN
MIILTVLGGVLPLAGLIWAWRAGFRQHAALDTDLRQIARLAQASGDDNEAATRAMYAVRQPTHTYAMELYTPELVERAILRSALDDLKGPALVAVIGVISATIGSLLSLWL